MQREHLEKLIRKNGFLSCYCCGRIVELEDYTTVEYVKIGKRDTVFHTRHAKINNLGRKENIQHG